MELGESEILLALSPDHVLTFRQAYTSPRELANNLQRISLKLEGFRTATEAEATGQVLAIAVLWSAISKRFTLVFAKWSGSLPFAVYDRTSGGLSFGVRGEGRSYWCLTASGFRDLIRPVYERSPEYDPSLVISMELYASARLELSERSRFITLVTALEALSEQITYVEDVTEALEQAATCFALSEHLLGASENIKNSITSRIRELRKESVRQAILRTTRAHLNDGDDVPFIDEAYGLRSKMLHEGIKVENLSELSYRLESVLRCIYASIIGATLEVPA